MFWNKFSREVYIFITKQNFIHKHYFIIGRQSLFHKIMIHERKLKQYRVPLNFFLTNIPSNLCQMKNSEFTIFFRLKIGRGFSNKIKKITILNCRPRWIGTVTYCTVHHTE